MAECTRKRPPRRAALASIVTHQMAEALKQGDEAAVRKLCREGFDLSSCVKIGEGLTSLAVATRDGNLEMVTLLLELNAPVDSGQIAVASNLWLASLNGKGRIASTLILHGADVEYVDANYGSTPLFAAVWFGHEDVATTLLDAGADPNVTALNSPFGVNVSPLRVACDRNNVRLVRLLLRFGADPDSKTSSGSTALTTSCHYAFHDAVQELMLAGCRTDYHFYGRKHYPIVCAIDSIFKDDSNDIRTVALLSLTRNYSHQVICDELKNRTGIWKLLQHRSEYFQASIQALLFVMHPFYVAAIFGLGHLIEPLLQRESDWLDPCYNFIDISWVNCNDVIDAMADIVPRDEDPSVVFCKPNMLPELMFTPAMDHLRQVWKIDTKSNNFDSSDGELETVLKTLKQSRFISGSTPATISLFPVAIRRAVLEVILVGGRLKKLPTEMWILVISFLIRNHWKWKINTSTIRA